MLIVLRVRWLLENGRRFVRWNRLDVLHGVHNWRIFSGFRHDARWFRLEDWFGFAIGRDFANVACVVTDNDWRVSVVLLAGMEAPPNFGRDYVVKFHRVYPDLAHQYHLALVPFLLQGVAGSETLNQRDGIHPTAEGYRIVVDHLWPHLEPLLTR